MAYADTWFEFWYPNGVIPAVGDVRDETLYGLEGTDEGTLQVVQGGGGLADGDIDEIVAGVVGAATALAARTDNSLDTDKACFIANDTWIQSFTGLGDLTGKTLIWTLKDSRSQSDSNSELKIDDTGLVIYKAAAEATASNGSIVVDDVLLGNITITVQSDRTDIDPGKYFQTVKALVSGTSDFTLYNLKPVVVSEGGVTQVSA